MNDEDIQPLSQNFLDQIRKVDKDNDEWTQQWNRCGEDERLCMASDLIDWYSELITSLEGFSQAGPAEILNRPRRGLKDSAWLDRSFGEFFGRHFLSNIPAYVEGEAVRDKIAESLLSTCCGKVPTAKRCFRSPRRVVSYCTGPSFRGRAWAS